VAKVRFVRNLETGLVHDVPEGHWSLGNAGYEAVPDPRVKVEPEASEKPKPKAKAKGRK